MRKAIPGTSKHQKPCRYCGKVVGGTNPSILEINYALHLKKHELRGDALNEGIVQKIGHILLGVSGLAMSIFGFLAEESLLTLLWLPVLGLPSWVWLVGGVVGVGVIFRFWLRKHRDSFRAALKHPSDWLWSFVIGGLGRGFWNLFWGLIPFYQNPWIFVVLTIYFAIIIDVLAMKRAFGRLSQVGRPQSLLG